MERNYTDYWASLTVSHASHPGNLFRYELIAEELQKAGVQPARVLDCGCGDGSLLSVIHSRLKCGELNGTDVAENVPLHKLGIPVKFRQQDLGKPVPGELHGQFDLVLCSEVIEHVPDDSMVLENLGRLAKPKGWIVLTTQSGNIYKTEQFLGHLRHYKLKELSDSLARQNVEIQKAYLCGWPWLNCQKIAAHIFQGTVQKNIVQASTLSLPVRIVFFVMYNLYKNLSSHSSGPQIIIVGRKS